MKESDSSTVSTISTVSAIKQFIKKVSLIGIASAVLLSCDRTNQPSVPPDHIPKPQTDDVASKAAMRNANRKETSNPEKLVHPAVYSYTGQPARLHQPDDPILVHHVAVRT